MKPVAVWGYQDIYGLPVPEDPLALLRPYPTDLIILYLAKINAILFQEADQQAQIKKIFEVVFLEPGMPHPNLEALLTKLLDNEHCTFFAIQSISYLIRAALENYKTLEETTEKVVKSLNKDVFDTILIYNELVFHTENSDLEATTGVWQIALRQQNYLRDFNALFYTAPVKFTFIQRYLESFDLGKKILTEFLAEFQIGNFWHFPLMLMKLVQNVLLESEKGKYIFPKSVINPKLLEHFTFDKRLVDRELTIHMDIIPKPFFEVDGDHVAVLDFNYFRYLMDQGIFWCLYQNTSLKEGADFKNYGSFRSTIGYEYFEGFLLSQLFNKIYCRKHHILIEKNPKLQDFWIKPNQNELIIVEAKMTDINPLTIEAFNVDRFRESINENFTQAKSDGKKAKGTAQLVEQIKQLVSGTEEILELLKIKSLNNLTVYPVIIYSDTVLDAAAVNSYINDAFTAQLGKIAEKATVRPVTMLNASILIDHFDQFMRDPNLLSGLLAAYYRITRSKQKAYVNNPGPYTYFEANISFADYVKSKLGMSKEKALQNLSALEKHFYINPE